MIVFFIALAGNAEAQRNYATNSVLSTGNWFKIGISREGVYKIDLPFLNSLGINTSGMSSSSIRLFGNGGAMLDENNVKPRQDDLFENPVEMFDGGDGIFNGSDYLLFYAPGPNRWLKDSLNQRFIHQKNLYTDTVFYFITIGGTGKRISIKNITLTPNQNVSAYNERYFYENDLTNFLNSGKQWYGETFSNISGNSLSHSFNVDFSGLITTQPLTISSSLAAASIGAPGNFTVNVNGQQIQNISIPAITGYFLDPVANEISQQNNSLATQPAITVAFNFNSSVSGAQGWLNWFELQGRRALAMNGKDQVFFRDWSSVANTAVAQFTVGTTTSATEVWEITDPLQPQKMATQFASSQTGFVNDASRLREYAVFNNANFLSPVSLGKVSNQNLHNSSVVDGIIITHSSLLAQANRLATFHTQHDGLTTIVATTDQIFNEFGSGVPDPTAIRDFVKMYYDKAGTDTTKRPKYLLLFGASSFDYKNRINNNSNLVPCYESINSLDPLSTYTSDDFFGLIKDSDDVNTISPPGLLAIGIGRLPARSLDEATTIVDKIIRYNSASGLGSWRNQTIFVADDKDNDIHLNDAEAVSGDAGTTNSLYNQSKIYLDAYPLVSGSGGGRYPAVNAAIVNGISNGVLFFNYNGHGGYQRLADEAVLGQTELNQFNNPDKLPLFITATCDFAPYDDPTKNSIGGSLLYGDSTGAIALMTTTRDVYAFSNRIMNDNYLKIALQPGANGNYLTLGEAVKQAKNYTYQTYTDVVNNRKFALLGDPAMRLAFPALRLQLTSINNHAVAGKDTLTALNTYVFAGRVIDVSGNFLNSFNGTLYPTVFDQPQQVSTLGNDPASPVTIFTEQTNILYKGKATVKNGLFNFTFIVPKDIHYQPGKGRLSLYADDGVHDANGVSTAFSVGGAGNAVLTDKSGPVIKLFMNDESFIDGGLTNETPVLLADLFDSSGINTSGAGIGHDITCIIDGNDKNVIVLNSYYEALLDSYQRGLVRYQLPVMTEGLHTIKVKAWDVADNSSEATIRFRVVKKQKIQIGNLFNYPNPMTTKTTFSFEHNQPGIDMDISLDILSSSGQLVYRLRKAVNDAGNRSNEITWDGKSIYGEKLSRGIYIYRIIVSSRNGMAQATQKLLLF